MKHPGFVMGFAGAVVLVLAALLLRYDAVSCESEPGTGERWDRFARPTVHCLVLDRWTGHLAWKDAPVAPWLSARADSAR